jgi:hypothetical protein
MPANNNAFRDPVIAYLLAHPGAQAWDIAIYLGRSHKMVDVSRALSAMKRKGYLRWGEAKKGENELVLSKGTYPQKVRMVRTWFVDKRFKLPEPDADPNERRVKWTPAASGDGLVAKAIEAMPLLQKHWGAME